MSKPKNSDVRKAEQLILQEAMLRSSVLNITPSVEFHENLRRKLAYGMYCDTDVECFGRKQRSGLAGLFVRVFTALSKVRLPALARYGGFCAVYIFPLAFILTVSSMVGRETSLSAIASEIQKSLVSTSSIYYEVSDLYANNRTGYRYFVLWKVWKAGGGYAYVERCDGDRPEVCLSRYYYGPNQAISIDDVMETVSFTNYHGRFGESERIIQEHLATPLGLGSELPVASSFARRPTKLQATGRQVVDGRICKTYSGGDGLQVWVDTMGLGFLRVIDSLGVTFNPDINAGMPGEVIHTIEVKNVTRNDVTPHAIFIPKTPEGYRRLETRDVYADLALPKNSLCFLPNMPDQLWEVFEKPVAYTVISGSGDSRLQVVLFRKGQSRDIYSALVLTQFRRAPLMAPVNGSVNDPDNKLVQIGSEYSWVTGATHFEVAVRNPNEHTGPDVNMVYKAILDRAKYLPAI